MTANLFVYGTLCFPQVVTRLIGRALDGEPATLDGYRLHALADRFYPGIVPQAGAVVAGVLYRDVDARAMAIFDEWEDEEYDRRTVTVLAAGEATSANAYVWKRADLVRGDWDIEEFRRERLHLYAPDPDDEPDSGGSPG